MLDETGGLHGLRDRRAIESLVTVPKQRVFGTVPYRTVFAKAAVYARSIAINHPFLDGNKRTAIVAAATLLELNGYRLSATRGEIEEFALRLVRKKLNLKMIAHWFRDHSKKIV